MALARAAQSLIGAPFRLHGRDADTGLDCLGLIGAALAITGRHVALPCDYSLRMRDLGSLPELAEAARLVRVQGARLAGDILLLRVAPCQFHLGVVAEDLGLVHAHAGLRRVVHSPLPQDPIIGRWRLPSP